MTSLAVIFILLLVATLNNALQEVEGSKSAVLASLTKALDEFRKKGVHVDADPTDPLVLLVVVPEDLLNFPVGRSEIPTSGVGFVKQFIPPLVGTACEKELRSEISSIIVEGHASSEGTEQRNLLLSQQRSMSVVQNGLEVLNPDLHNCFLQFVSATGRGSAEPFKQQGIENRPKSRRVIFKVRVKSTEQRQFISDIKSSTATKETAR